MDRPAAHAVHVAGYLRAIDGSVLDEAVQRSGKVAHGERLGRPIIHLEVYVGRIVGPPCGIAVGIPDALEICRNAVGPRTAYQQVADETEIHHLQAGVRGAFGIAGQTPVGRHLRKGGIIIAGEPKLQPVGNGLVISDMRFTHGIRILALGGIHPLLRQSLLIHSVEIRITVEAGKTGRSADHYRDRGCAAYPKPRSRIHFAVTLHRLYAILVAHAFLTVGALPDIGILPVSAHPVAKLSADGKLVVGNALNLHSPPWRITIQGEVERTAT